MHVIASYIDYIQRTNYSILFVTFQQHPTQSEFLLYTHKAQHPPPMQYSNSILHKLRLCCIYSIEHSILLPTQYSNSIIQSMLYSSQHTLVHNLLKPRLLHVQAQTHCSITTKQSHGFSLVLLHSHSSCCNSILTALTSNMATGLCNNCMVNHSAA